MCFRSCTWSTWEDTVRLGGYVSWIQFCSLKDLLMYMKKHFLMYQISSSCYFLMNFMLFSTYIQICVQLQC